MLPLDVQHWRERVELLQREGDRDSAIALALAFPSPGYRVRLLIRLGALALAWEQAEHLDERSYGWSRLSRAFRKAGLLDEAIACAFRLPNAAVREKRIAEAQQLAERWLTNGSSEQRYAAIRLLSSVQLHERALECAQQESHSHLRLQLMLAFAYGFFRQGEKSRAEGLCRDVRQAIITLPHLSHQDKIYGDLAYCAFLRDNEAEGLATLRQVQDSSWRARNYRTCAELVVNQGKEALARRLLEKSTQEDQNDPAFYLVEFAERQAEQGREPFVHLAFDLAEKLCETQKEKQHLQLVRQLVLQQPIPITLNPKLLVALATASTKEQTIEALLALWQTNFDGFFRCPPGALDRPLLQQAVRNACKQLPRGHHLLEHLWKICSWAQDSPSADLLDQDLWNMALKLSSQDDRVYKLMSGLGRKWSAERVALVRAQIRQLPDKASRERAFTWLAGSEAARKAREGVPHAQ